MLALYNHEELFHLTLEILSHPCAVGMTERPCSRKLAGKSECEAKCRALSLPAWNFSPVLRSSCESAGGISPQRGLRPQISRPWQSPSPSGSGWGKCCSGPRQPRDAGCFQQSTKHRPFKPSYTPLGSWGGGALSAEFLFLCSLADARSYHPPRRFIISAKSESLEKQMISLPETSRMDGQGHQSPARWLPGLRLREKGKNPRKGILTASSSLWPCSDSS